MLEFFTKVMMFFHMLVGLILIGIILLQRGRGGGLAGAFGGMGGQSAFGTKAGDVFTKITIWIASIWIVLGCICVVMASNFKGKKPQLATGFAADVDGKEKTDATKDKSDEDNKGDEPAPMKDGDSTVPALKDSTDKPGDVEKPKDPAPKSDVPAEKPKEPEAKTAEPTEKPNPDAKPEEPKEKPAVPEDKPKEPGEKPADPTEEPKEPAEPKQE